MELANISLRECKVENSQEITRGDTVQQIIDIRGRRIGVDFSIRELTVQELLEIDRLNAKLIEIGLKDCEVFGEALKRIQTNQEKQTCRYCGQRLPPKEPIGRLSA